MAAVPASSTTKWLSFFADNSLLDDDTPPNVLWAQAQHQAGQIECSADNVAAKTDECEDSFKDVSGSRKRAREDSGRDGACSKANREKLRRDRLNDRFIELSRVLEEDGKPPKADKATILCDAVRVIGQLRQEAVSLKEGNEQLKEQIRELKAEKNELKEEKARLKDEKDKLEKQVKSMSFTHGFPHHTAAMQAAAAAYASQGHAQAGIPAKLQAPAPVAPVAMWQWLPPAAVDTSQDHVLRPPVA